MANTLSNDRTIAWVTRPEGAKDEVKQARRAANLKSSPVGALDFESHKHTVQGDPKMPITLLRCVLGQNFWQSSLKSLK